MGKAIHPYIECAVGIDLTSPIGVVEDDGRFLWGMLTMAAQLVTDGSAPHHLAVAVGQLHC